jgi:hypothetical protein
MKRQRERLRKSPTLGRYAKDPVGYCNEVLGIQLWGKQEEMLLALIRPPFKVLGKASHSVGKSFVAAAAVSWWFDTRNPGVVLTTAPTARQVRDILWKEIRVQRGAKGLGGFVGPKMPRLESAPNHFAHGFTAAKESGFQGQHDAAVMLVIDEAVGVGHEIWEAAKTMLQGVEYAAFAIFNPTDTTSQAYLEETGQDCSWTVITMPATEHPNLADELAGRPPTFPKAVRLGWFEERLREWCQAIPAADRKATDVEWPPGGGSWWRPGPVAEARLLGRWPSAGTYGVWSDLLWSLVETARLEFDARELPQVGCDVARYGDDWTCIHSRWGPVSLGHESANGWSTSETAGRLKQVCRELAARVNAARERHAEPVQPEQIPVMVDDDGVGGGVTDQRGDFKFIPVSGASRARRPEDYPNKRSELWFHTAGLANEGKLDLSRLAPDARQRLRQQAMAPTWRLDAQGRRVVEPKEDTKDKIGRSPDDMDAMNLSYYEGCEFLRPAVIPNPGRRLVPVAEEGAAQRRGLFGAK